jgi:hypothetical protein
MTSIAFEPQLRKAILTTTVMESLNLTLPYPYFTRHTIRRTIDGNGAARHNLQVVQESSPKSQKLEQSLHSESLFFSKLRPGKAPPSGDNTAFAGAQASPSAYFLWTCAGAPTLGQLWLEIYALITLYPHLEQFRLSLRGT